MVLQYDSSPHSVWDISDSVCRVLLLLVLFALRALTFFPAAWGVAVVFVMSTIVAIVTLYILFRSASLPLFRSASLPLFVAVPLP